MKVKKTNELIEKFNSQFKIGDSLMWKPSKNAEPKKVTVKHAAYNNYGTPVAFFNEVSGFCSIDPMFVQY